MPVMIDDAACWSFRALRFAQGKRSAGSARDAHDPSRCSGVIMPDVHRELV
ncbi:MAG: hypothetical protein KatS3mg058_0836 [Roseiflexus sp.]|nr:MAG: hypothetical protein KatS3mg058_0836 [Roseiflexus sp.]